MLNELLLMHLPLTICFLVIFHDEKESEKRIFVNQAHRNRNMARLHNFILSVEAPRGKGRESGI